MFFHHIDKGDNHNLIFLTWTFVTHTLLSLWFVLFLFFLSLNQSKHTTECGMYVVWMTWLMKAKIQFCIKLLYDECFILTTEVELGVMLVSYKFTFVTSSQVGGGIYASVTFLWTLDRLLDFYFIIPRTSLTAYSHIFYHCDICRLFCTHVIQKNATECEIHV